MDTAGLQNPHTVAFWAANLEAAQAERDAGEAHDALVAVNYRYGSAEDYALWSTCGYADTAARLVRALPVWER